MADTKVCIVCVWTMTRQTLSFFHIHFVLQMTQNMFQEGLYHVFFKDSPRTSTQASSSGMLTNGRIHRWFGTVVNTRLLVSGVRSVALKGSFLPFDPSFLLVTLS